MSGDLAVDEFEAALGIGDLIAEAGGKLSEQVTMLAGCGFSIKVQLSYLASEQCVALGIERGNVALRVLDLAGDAEKLGGFVFAGDQGVDLAVIVEQTLKGFGIATFVSLVGKGHEQGEVLLLGIIAGEVRMDPLGDLAEESLEIGRRVELLGLVGFAECSVVGLLRLPASLLGPTASRFGVIEGHLAFGDTGFKIVKLSVENAYLPEVTAFEGRELSTDLGKLRFALRERGANGGELLSPGE
jgi:hypothetical protein